MARMIPPLIDPDVKPPVAPGEVIIFEALKHEPGTEDWVVLHSLDLPQHVRQLQGEIDFVVVVPGGAVICLEVKSHTRVARGADRLWRLGGDDPEVRGPFKQASEGAHSLRKRVSDADRALASVPFVSAVTFPRCNFNVEAVEWEPWQVIDENALRLRPLGESIRSLIAHARARYRAAATASWFRDAAGEPTPEHCDRLEQLMRPIFEVMRSPKARREARDAELRRFTNEQFEALNGIERNQHVLLTGPAGTGKTLLALEAARRQALAGNSAVLCCYNSLLGAWLRSEAEPLSPQVRAGTLHSLMLEIAGLAPPPDAPTRFWDDELPVAAADALLGGHPLAGSFGAALIDEAQDLARPKYLDVLGLLLEKGLKGSTVFAFGDFARQAIYDRGGEPETELRAAVPGLVSYTLGMNCRNRPRIGGLITRLAGLSACYRGFRRPDDGIEADPYFYTDPADQAALLERELNRLRQEQFAFPDITILSMRADRPAAELLGEPWRSRICEAWSARSGCTRYTTVHAFKGLESTAVVVTDVDRVGEAAEALLYVAMSRATDRLILLASEAAKADLWNTFWKGGR